MPSNPIPKINDQWNKFAEMCKIENAPALQRKEMKRAFFAGFLSAFGSIVDGVSSMTDDEAEAALKSLDMQLRGFTEAVLMGGA